MRSQDRKPPAYPVVQQFLTIKSFTIFGSPFKVPWPLHLIVSPEVIEKYNAIFR